MVSVIRTPCVIMRRVLDSISDSLMGLLFPPAVIGLIVRMTEKGEMFAREIERQKQRPRVR